MGDPPIHGPGGPGPLPHREMSQGEPSISSDENMEMTDHDKLLAESSNTIRLDPTKAEAWFARGQVHFATGAYRAAIRDLAEAIHLRPDYGHAYALRANVYYTRNDLENAETDCRRAIQLDATCGSAWDVYGRI